MHQSEEMKTAAAAEASSSTLLSQPAAGLRKLRLEAGMTQEELAREAGLSAYAISGYEQGRFGMKVSALSRLANALANRLGRDSSLLLPALVEDHAP